MRRLDNVRTIVFDKVKDNTPTRRYQNNYYSYRFGSGREALFALLQSRQWANKTVLLPAFVPEGVYYPFAHSGWQIVYYELDAWGNPDFDDIASRILLQPPAIAVLIHLFGVLRDAPRFSQCLPDSCLFIEDFAHSMPGQWLDHYSLSGNMALFSPPKLLGVVDGCEMLCKEKANWPKLRRLSLMRSLYLLLRFGALVLATASNRWGSANSFNLLETLAARCYNWAYRVHISFCNVPHTFSKLGQWMLAHTPIEKIAEQRLAQALLYQQGLQNAEIKSLYNTQWGVLPLIGFPVKVADRQHFERYLHQHGINGAAYAPKWWFLDAANTPHYPQAHNLWASHYVLPVNQKLSEADILKVLEVVNQYQQLKS